jgi:hypothetical protein
MMGCEIMDSTRITDICREMSAVRSNGREGVAEMVDSAQTLTDWRHYVNSHPWLCLAGAAVLGFMVVPKRMVVFSPSADVIEELAKRNEVASKSMLGRKNGFVGSVFGVLANLALQEAMNIVGQTATSFFATGGAKGATDEKSNFGRTAGRGMG